MTTTRITLALLAAALGAAAAPAAESIRDQVRDSIATKIKQILAEEKRDAVSIGEFTGPSQLNTNASAGLQQILADELTALGVKVDKAAELSVKGRYAVVDDKADPKTVTVRLTAEVFNRNDERLGEFAAAVRDTGDIARLLGVTGFIGTQFGSGQGGGRRNENLRDQIDHPTVTIDGTRVKTSRLSPYAVEVLVKSGPGAPPAARRAEAVNGEAFVGIERGEIYELQVYNHTDAEAGVTVTIDGLDAYTFSEVRDPVTNRAKYTKHVIPAAAGGRPGVAKVMGWHLRDTPPDNYASFLVTEYGKGASSQAVAVPKKGKPGVITLTFARPLAVAVVKSTTALPGAAPPVNNETGVGPRIGVPVQAVKREFGEALEAISIRYVAENK